MNKKVIYIGALVSLLSLSGCEKKLDSLAGYTKLDIELTERDRYDNVYDEEHLPNQWANYGTGDPFLMRYNGEYYLYASTKDNNPGYKVWKSHDLVHFEFLGDHGIYDTDGVSTARHLGQYAPEIYYWNGDFYMFGSPSGNGHHIYKSIDGTPYGDFVSLTGNIGLSIDGSLFIDDDESMHFLHASDGCIKAYQMNSITEPIVNSYVDLLAPLIKWTEGPCMIKHNGTYYLTYTGNHVKSRGYRVDYSYSTEAPDYGFVYPQHNSVLLKTLDDEQNGLGHSSTVLGPNLDSYYISYHNLDDASGPIRSYNINRVSFTDNRMTVYGPTSKGAQAPVLPDFVDYDGTKMNESNGVVQTNEKTQDRFTAEYNFKNVTPDGSFKLTFGGSDKNYVAINGKAILLYLNNNKVGEGTLVNDFDFTKLHTVRLAVDGGHYRVFFDNLQKIDVNNVDAISGGEIGYVGVDKTNIGTTTFSNDAFDSSDAKEAKLFNGNNFMSNYMPESKLTGKSGKYMIEEDDYDLDTIYSGTSAVKLANKGDYLVYPIDALEDTRYGLDLMFKQSNAGSYITVQVDNEKPTLVKIPEIDFRKNMNEFESNLQFVKSKICELDLTKGLHTLKFELVKGEVDLVYFESYKNTKYDVDFTHNLNEYMSKGASYLSLWKIEEDEGTLVHKAKAGVNNMVLVGTEAMTDYEVSVDIKLGMSASNNSYAGMIVRCNNPSMYSGYIDASAQGYWIAFNRMQLVGQRINYNSATTNVMTGNIGLNQYHNLKIRCEGNTITTYFDGKEAFSYTDPNPYSHGLVDLYSVNAESYYKNLSIKGI